MFCRIAGVTAVGLLISAGAWAQDTGQTTTGTQTTTQTTTDTQTTTTRVDTSTPENRTYVELSGFAGWTFNQGLQFNNSAGQTTTNFYNNVGPKDRITYGASLGFDVTPNLEIGFLWSGQNSRMELRNFNTAAATAVGFTPGGTSATGSGGTKTVSYPVLLTANGANSYDLGKFNVNNFHGIVAWNFGHSDAMVRPFVFGGAGVTRFGDLDYSYMNVVTTTTSTGAAGTGATSTTTSVTPVSATIPGVTRFSTTWGLGVNIAPTRAVAIRIAGRLTPTRLTNGSYAAFGTNGGNGTVATGTGSSAAVSTGSGSWWCNSFSGCSANSTIYSNQWSVTGGLTFRF